MRWVLLSSAKRCFHLVVDHSKSRNNSKSCGHSAKNTLLKMSITLKNVQTLDFFFWSFIRVVRFLKRLKIYNCPTNKKEEKQQQHRDRDVLWVQNLINTASKQSLAKCLYWSSGPACWCCDLLSGRSHTWERKKNGVWSRSETCGNLVEISAHTGRLKDNCCFLLYSHKEETGAHVVRYGTHPDVPVLFEVLWGDHCGRI